jgi:hypothetical protein
MNKKDLRDIGLAILIGAVSAVVLVVAAVELLVD